LFSHVVNAVVFHCSASYLLYLNLPQETEIQPEEKMLAFIEAVTIVREMKEPSKKTGNTESGKEKRRSVFQCCI
jgi:hypothetical protein